MGLRTGAIILYLSKNFNLLQYDRLLTEIAATGVELKVVEWVKEFVLGRSQRNRADRQMSEEFRVNCTVP